MAAIYGRKTSSVEFLRFHPICVVKPLAESRMSACLLAQNARQLGAQGGYALGRAEVIALHHVQDRLQRGLRITPEVRFIALAVHIFHIVDEVERLTKLEAGAASMKAP